MRSLREVEWTYVYDGPITIVPCLTVYRPPSTSVPVEAYIVEQTTHLIWFAKAYGLPEFAYVYLHSMEVVIRIELMNNGFAIHGLKPFGYTTMGDHQSGDGRPQFQAAM